MAALANSYRWEGVSWERERGVIRRVEEEKTRKKNGYVPNLRGRRKLTHLRMWNQVQGETMGRRWCRWTPYPSITNT